VNVKIALFGIRDLIRNAIKPTITFRLTSGNQKPHEIKFENPLHSKNPNITKFIQFENIKLPFEPLLWPLLEVDITDEGNMLGLGGCEACHTTITLFEFATDLLSEK